MLRKKLKRLKPRGKSSEAEHWDGTDSYERGRPCNGGDTNEPSRKRVLGAAPKMGEGLPGSACRSRPQTASVLLHSKGVVVSDRGKGAIKASGMS